MRAASVSPSGFVALVRRGVCWGAGGSSISPMSVRPQCAPLIPIKRARTQTRPARASSVDTQMDKRAGALPFASCLCPARARAGYRFRLPRPVFDPWRGGNNNNGSVSPKRLFAEPHSEQIPGRESVIYARFVAAQRIFSSVLARSRYSPASRCCTCVSGGFS